MDLTFGSQPPKVLFFQVILDTMGPELQVSNTTGNPIELKAGDRVSITPSPNLSKVPSAEVLPINYSDLAKVIS